jgi:hypothetical protein
MKTSLIAAGLVTLALTAIGAQEQPAAKRGPALEQTLIANERALYDAVAKRDKAAFQSLVLADGIWTTPTGFVPMGPLASALSEFEMSGWGIVNPRVVWTEGNSALVLYTRTGGGSFGGRTFSSMMLASTLWTRRAGKWLAVHHQESALTQ